MSHTPEDRKMEDRKLLEMAAKAGGIRGRFTETHPEDGAPCYSCGINRGDRTTILWNPLTDDGDALRLANRLCMMVSTGPCEARASTIEGALRGYFPKESTIGCGQDKAVRRVIVLAAAEIGKSMP